MRYSSFLLATLSTDVETRFADLEIPLRFFSDEGAGASHRGRRILLVIRTHGHLHPVELDGPKAFPRAIV